jgi:hypothetical protein
LGDPPPKAVLRPRNDQATALMMRASLSKISPI